MLFQGKDGELRITEYGSGVDSSAVTYYMKVLFCEMNYDGPVARPRTEEKLIMDRGNFDTNAHYVEGNDEPRYTSIPITFSCRLADTINTRALADWVSGATNIPNAVGGTTRVYSWDGITTIDGNTLPAFRDTGKQSYRVEMLWDGTSDLGFRNDEVYFSPGENKITESAEGLTLSCNGQVYGDVTRITSFYTAGGVTGYKAFV